MRLLNISIGILLLLIIGNEFFNYSSFQISDFLIGIGLIVYGIVMVLSSITFQSKFSSGGGISKETSSTSFRGWHIFLGLLSVFMGIVNMGFFGLEFLSTFGTAILGFLFIISK